MIILSNTCLPACLHNLICIILISSEKLRQYFEAFGAVQDAVVMKDPVSRRSRGFGFITFEHTSFVDKVLEQEVHTIDSRKVCALVISHTCFIRIVNHLCLQLVCCILLSIYTNMYVCMCACVCAGGG